MARVRRIDLGTLASPTRRADGTMVAQARITRTGVFTYRNADGSEHREYRPDSSVHDAKSLASFQLVPLTDDHPPMMLNASNARQYAVGAVGQDVRKDGDHVVATIVVHDKNTIAKMDAGKVFVSCGYDCELDETAGIAPNGEHYDAIQTHIAGNHLAIVDNPRAGVTAAVRMDALFFDPDTTTRRSDVMDLAQALAALATANTALGTVTARADAADKALQTLQAKYDDTAEKLKSAETARTDALAMGPTLVKARVALEAGARRVLGSRCDAIDGKPAEVDVTNMKERDIKLAIIKHVTDADCNIGPDGKPRADEYISARYDAAIERAADSADTFRAAHDAIETGRATGGRDDAESKKTDDARAEMLKANRGAGRTDSTTVSK